MSHPGEEEKLEMSVLWSGRMRDFSSASSLLIQFLLRRHTDWNPSSLKWYRIRSCEPKRRKNSSLEKWEKERKKEEEEKQLWCNCTILEKQFLTDEFSSFSLFFFFFLSSFFCIRNSSFISWVFSHNNSLLSWIIHTDDFCWFCWSSNNFGFGWLRLLRERWRRVEKKDREYKGENMKGRES